MNKLKLVDYIKINPDPSFSDLSRREKVGIIDSLLSRSDNRRGLYVTYNLSHSGRRINNRIYTVAGQKKGIDSLLSPYPKPIIRNHDDHDDPIGRFVGGVWEDMSSDALGFFDDVNDFMKVQAAFDADDPERIYRSMKEYGLLTRKKWPGLGSMKVTARISDQDSIEKFLDGRYITFSAGSTTDRHVCSVCMEDWAKGDVCEHRHGKIYDDELCVFVTGNFDVLEGSVVNMPADDLSQVLSMELADSVKIEDLTSIKVDKHTVYLTDSKYSLKKKRDALEDKAYDHMLKIPEVAMETLQSSGQADVVTTSGKETMTIRLVYENASEDSNGSKLLKNDKHNYSEKNMSEEINNTAKTEVLAEDSEVLSSEENKAEETEAIASVDASEEVVTSNDADAEKVSEETETAEMAGDLDKDSVKVLADLILEVVRKELNLKEVSDGKLENDDDASAKEKEEKTEALNVDKVEDDKTEKGTKEERVLEEVLNFDKPLTTEQRNKLKESTFCGPERSYPVPDKSHAVAALSRAKQHASPELYKKIKDCVCRKSDKNGWDLPSCQTDMNWGPELTKEALEKESIIMGWDTSENSNQELKLDYANALSRIEMLEKELKDALSYLKNVDKEISLEKESSGLVPEVAVSDSVSDAVETVENPSIASTDNDSSPRTNSGSKKLGAFEKKVCKEYSKLLEKDGLNFAENYLRSKRRYLRRGFHPKNYIQLGD